MEIYELLGSIILWAVILIGIPYAIIKIKNGLKALPEEIKRSQEKSNSKRETNEEIVEKYNRINDLNRYASCYIPCPGQKIPDLPAWEKLTPKQRREHHAYFKGEIPMPKWLAIEER